MSENSLMLAHPEDLEQLRGFWQQVQQQKRAQFVHLTAPMGGGKRAMVGEFSKGLDPNTLIMRPPFIDEEDGQGVMIRLYSALYSALHRNPTLRGRVEMSLNSQLPSQSQRGQGWFSAFTEGLKLGGPKSGEQQMQINIPRDNPLLGFVEIVLGIAKNFPVIIDLQNLHTVQSLPFFTMLNALLQKSAKAEDVQLLVVLNMVPVTGNESWLSLPLQDVLKQQSETLNALEMKGWNAELVKSYINSMDDKVWVDADSSRDTLLERAEEISTIAKSLPGYVSELVDILKDDRELVEALPELSLESFANIAPDEDELSEESSEDSDSKSAEDTAAAKRRKANAEDANLVAHASALLGLSFPSGVIADMCGLDRGSVDDLLDATENIYEELQRSEPLNTWVYRFKRALYRESILSRNSSEEDRKRAANVGLFMEQRLANAGYGYITKTMHIYNNAGALQRAAMMRNAAMNADNPQLWSLALDIIKYCKDCTWSSTMIRSIYVNLCERMTLNGDPEQAERLIQEAIGWAKGGNREDELSQEDTSLQAYLLLAGSRLDRRRQDLFRSRERAVEALEMYRQLENTNQQGEALAQIAIIEFRDGQFNAALDRATEAESTADAPSVKALTHLVRGLVAQREGKGDDAIKAFNESTQFGQQSGRNNIVLEAGMKIGETLMGARQLPQACDTLSQVAQMARMMRAPMQERTASALLAQAHGGQQNFEAALQFAQRTLQLSQQMKLNKLLPVDLYNVGLFNLMLQKPSEAIAILKKSKEISGGANAGFKKELFFNLAQAQLQIGEKVSAEENLRSALRPAAESGDAQKLLISYQQLSALSMEKDDKDNARKLLEEALKVAKQTRNKDAEKDINDRLRNIR